MCRGTFDVNDADLCCSQPRVNYLFGPKVNRENMPALTNAANCRNMNMLREPIVSPKQTDQKKQFRSSRPYSSKIIKAGALIADTKTLLSHWDVKTSVADNIHRVQRENVFGKSSRSRVNAILAIFRQRYLTEESVTRALATLVRRRFPTAALARLLYFHAARADQLLHDAVTEILVPMQARGLVDIDAQNFQRSLAKWVEEGKTTGHWSEPTITRISQGLLSALRDFGVLEGAVHKKISSALRSRDRFGRRHLLGAQEAVRPGGHGNPWRLEYSGEHQATAFLVRAAPGRHGQRRTQGTDPAGEQTKLSRSVR